MQPSRSPQCSSAVASSAVLSSVLVLVSTVLCSTAAMPYHSTQGILHTRPSLNDFLSTYLQAAQQQQEPHYGYPEYQPTYQQGYISNRPRRVQMAQQQPLEPLMQYLSAGDGQQDYSNYDYNNNEQMYNDGTWYDDTTDAAAANTAYANLGNTAGYNGYAGNVAGNNNGYAASVGNTGYGSSAHQPSGPSMFLSSEPTEQDLALAQLMLDHIAGKYSLEDLETLEREARIEENSENQLRALTKKVHRKKSLALPFMRNSGPSRSAVKAASRSLGLSRASPRMTSVARGSPDGLITMTQRRGQKEEPVMVPATNVRRPIFVQHLEKNPTKTEDESSQDETQQADMRKKKSSVSLESSPSGKLPSNRLSSSASSNTLNAASAAATSPNTAATGFEEGSLKSSSGDRPRSSDGVVEVVKVAGAGNEGGPAPSSPSAGSSSSNLVKESSQGDTTNYSTMAPYEQSAYEALQKYLDTERRARIDADQELFKSPQKRFVQDPDPLPRELNKLKKTVV